MRRTGASLEQLETLYRARFAHFVGIAAAICRDADGGRDAVQSAFASAVKSRRSFRDG